MSGTKILIVDDEPAIRTLLRCAVSAPGFSVFEADCGKAALSGAAEQGPFELVVSDVLMPGMDGIELATKLAGDGQAQRFLFISGYCDGNGVAERTRDLPACEFLPKPFSIPELMRVFRGLLEQESVNVRVASVREKRAPRALRPAAARVDAMWELRRKSRRFETRRDTLIEDAHWGLRTYAVLVRQIESQYAAIEAIQRRVPARRVVS